MAMKSPVAHISRAVCISAALAIPFVTVAQVTLTNPLGSNVNSVDDVLANIIKVFLGVVGGVTLFIFVYGGMMMLMSAGNPEKVKKGQSAMVWAALGLLFIFGSYGLTQFIFELLGG
ncbi:MAG: pilin [Candidatus Kerfeldbacteria bacterium]|nr:pilin [Candidatus Kerfeldbacteria bacterium]